METPVRMRRIAKPINVERYARIKTPARNERKEEFGRAIVTVCQDW